MHKVILDHQKWLLWTKQGISPLNFESLPDRFILGLNPLLYLFNAGIEKVAWSTFQQQALSQLHQSKRQIVASHYLCEFAQGNPQGEILTLGGLTDILCVKTQDMLFQSAEKKPLSDISAYLKRFGIRFMPCRIPLTRPSLLKVVRLGFKIIPQLQAQHVSWRSYVKVNVSMAILSGILAVGSGTSLWVLWNGQQQLAHYKGQGSLTPEQQNQARLFQDYTQLTSAINKIDWTKYDRFLKTWRQKIVITQIRYDGRTFGCHFIMHPDFKEEFESIRDWLKHDLPRSHLEEGENVELRLSFAAN